MPLTLTICYYFNWMGLHIYSQRKPHVPGSSISSLLLLLKSIHPHSPPLHWPTLWADRPGKILPIPTIHALLQIPLLRGGGLQGVSMGSHWEGVCWHDGRHLLHEYRPLPSQSHQDLPITLGEAPQSFLTLCQRVPRPLCWEAVQGTRPWHGYRLLLQFWQRG